MKVCWINKITYESPLYYIKFFCLSTLLAFVAPCYWGVVNFLLLSGGDADGAKCVLSLPRAWGPQSTTGGPSDSPAVWPWASHIPSLNFCLLVWKMKDWIQWTPWTSSFFCWWRTGGLTWWGLRGSLHFGIWGCWEGQTDLCMKSAFAISYQLCKCRQTS